MLTSRVTRLKPRRGSYEESLNAFASGDFPVSLELLSDARTLPELVLSGRNLIRLGSPDDALAAVSGTCLQDAPHEIAAEALIVQISSLNVLRRFDDASRLAVEARVRSISSGIVAIEAELLYVQALGHVLEGDYTKAELSALAILELEPRPTSWIAPTTYRFNLAYMRFRACDLLGAIEETRSNYPGRVRWLSQAFAEFDQSGVRDDYVEAMVLSNLADATIGTDLDKVFEFAVSRAKRIEWSSAIATYEFRTFRALAQASSIAGDQLGALRFLRRCNSCAPTAALQLQSTVERARIFSDIGEAFSSREELEHAVRLSKSINWASVGELDQRQLVFLAAQVANYSGCEAQGLLLKYDGLKSSLRDTISVKDDRFRGEELFARSTVLRAIGEFSRANIALLDAFEIFNACNDPLNAANAAVALAEHTGESRYLEVARAQSEKQPHSTLARKVARLRDLMASGSRVTAGS